MMTAIAAPSDPVQQTTERLVALNRTLELIEEAARNPMAQSKGERDDRRNVRREVYAEIERLVGPEPTIVLATSKPNPQELSAVEREIGGAHAGL